MTILKKSILTLSAVTAIALSGCGGDGGTFENQTVTGVLADGAIGNASYECGTTTGFTNVKGEFTCPVGSSVDFYYGNIKLGGVSTLPSDKIVLIQDVLDINRSDVNHSVVTRLAVFLQSMDNDSNHSNGIYLDPSYIATTVPTKVDFTTFDDDKITELFYAAQDIKPSLERVSQETARANLQAVTDNVLNFQKIDGNGENTSNNDTNNSTPTSPTDTTAPNTPTLNSEPTMTRDDSIAVVINGEVGSKIFINGTDTNLTIGTDGTKEISLDTSGEIGIQTFSITLKDSRSNTSNAKVVNITKKAPCMTLNGAYYNGSLISQSNPITLGVDSNITLNFSNDIDRSGLNISATDANITLSNIAKSADSNISFDYLASSNLITNSLADYNSTNSLAISQDTCNIQANINLFKNIITGQLDPSFATNGYAVYNTNISYTDAEKYSIVLDNSENIYITGFSNNSNNDMTIWKYKSDGTLDNSFGTNGVVIDNNASGGNSRDRGNDIAIDSNDEPYVVGISSDGTNGDMTIWKFK